MIPPRDKTPAPFSGLHMRRVPGRPSAASSQRWGDHSKALAAWLFSEWQREQGIAHAEVPAAAVDSGEHAATAVGRVLLDAQEPRAA